MGDMEHNDDTPVVAFLGPKASYTHQATISHFPQSTHTLAPQITIEDVFSAVQSGSAAYGVVPFENSSNGSVVFTLDLFADTTNQYGDIVVAGEVYLPVRHCLVGRRNRHESRLGDLENERKSSSNQSTTKSTTRPTPTQTSANEAKPLHDLTHIKKLYSHPQAWGQCKQFLNTHLKHAERQDVSSTSKAAEIIATTSANSSQHPRSSDEDRTTAAAISSKLAAELNNLDILAEGIEDSAGNSTRFFILRNQKLHHTTTLPRTPSNEEESSRHKTLISFSVPPSAAAGALADSLAIFKKHNLNLTSINTRPSGKCAWHYIFFIECMGLRRREEVGGGGAVNVALKELEGLVDTCRWLGSWERADVE